MEEILRIEAPCGPLFGILHRPPAGVPDRGVGLVVVNSRVEYRVGPHRFSVEAARHWAQRGFSVLRFDYSGNGDSPGEASYPGMDSFPVEPIPAVAETLRRRAGVERLAIVGNCMGARNALFAGAALPAVDGLVLFGMPFSNATPFVALDDVTETRAMSASVARSTLRGYVDRLNDPGAWKRLFRGKSEVDVMLRAFGSLLGFGRGRVFKEPVFLSMKAFFGRGGRAVFVFGRNDVFLPDFDHELGRVKDRLPRFDELATVDYVASANHTFSRIHWKTEALERSTQWLESRYPSAGTPAAAGMGR